MRREGLGNIAQDLRKEESEIRVMPRIMVRITPVEQYRLFNVFFVLIWASGNVSSSSRPYSGWSPSSLPFITFRGSYLLNSRLHGLCVIICARYLLLVIGVGLYVLLGMQTDGGSSKAVGDIYVAMFYTSHALGFATGLFYLFPRAI